MRTIKIMDAKIKLRLRNLRNEKNKEGLDFFKLCIIGI